MGRFAQRSDAIELMDDLECSGPVLHQTLKELGIINSLLGGNAVTLGGLNALLKKLDASGALHIADLGCGGGDLSHLISQWGERNGYRFRLTGIDANPNIVAYARAKFAKANIEFLSMDIFSDEFREKRFDIVVGTLFFHHFTNEQLIHFFKQLRSQVRLGWVINDIHRHWFAYHSIHLITQLFSRSAMVKTDAPLSVLRAFSRQDVTTVLEQAGIRRYEIRWRWAFRWQIIVYV